MQGKAIKSSQFDFEFRKVVLPYIQQAKKTIKIVTGEISAYNYFELRKAAEEAAERGVGIQVYANGPDQNISNRLIHHKIEVYTGSEEIDNEHFMIIDDKEVIISQKGRNRKIPTEMGERKGYVIKDDAPEVKKRIKLFRMMLESSKKEKIRKADPVFELTEKPLNLGQLSDEYPD